MIHVKAIFQRLADAEGVQHKLQALRVEQLSIAEHGGYTAPYQGYLRETGDPEWYNLGNLSAMSMLAYSTSALSGVFATGANMLKEASHSYLLTASVHEERYAQVKQVIEQSGGAMQ